MGEAPGSRSEGAGQCDSGGKDTRVWEIADPDHALGLNF